MRIVGALVVAALAAVLPRLHAVAARPNIVWIIVDDMSANFGCYGERLVPTPHVDRLAAEGTRFTHAFVTCPVCSPCRSALITGMYQTSIGAHHHRSGRGVETIHLPAGVRPVPERFREAGYFTCIGDGDEPSRSARPRAGRLGKTDYNFVWDESMYDGSDWSGRAAGQPFFMQVMLSGGKLRGGTAEAAAKLADRAARAFGASVRPEDVALPPYLPRDPVLLADQAAYLDAVRFTDAAVGLVVDRLAGEGILDDTLVIFMTDHGISHVRAKQFLYDEGTHVPLVIRGPGIEAGAVRDDLVEHIDLPALSLAAAGLPIPASMQGRDVFAPDYVPRDAVFAARDRCDETVDRIRSVRTERFLYIRNYHPRRPLLQPNAYKDGKTILQSLRALHDAGRLAPETDRLLYSPTRAVEELYDWRADPWQMSNRADDPSLRTELDSLRARLDRWMRETVDRGPETEAMYDSEMRVYVGNGNPEVERNIATMKRWAAEGR